MMRHVFALAAALLTAAPAQAAPPPTIDFTHVLLDDDGAPVKDEVTRAPDDDPVKDPWCKSCKAMTVGDACYRALTTILWSRERPNPDELEAWHALGVRIRRDPHGVLKPPEIVAIEKRLGVVGFSGLVSSSVKRAIDPTYETPAVK